ncbi:type I restriction-modification system subunit M [Schleiferilactobacillus perolens]|jgi:type I restriction enzyme M protein|uniref:type I restriction-modification system subunit M n=1 Tax=Schleiferilactobacillus perolens TaxID=100468 RepID=UPI0023531C72|nr:type I restriction-modification system subunit M [Schleiferilactobacillus perolens]MCI2170047.1 type I restriction-modification system subunit M [Schleiferilactobacillus perolens]
MENSKSQQLYQALWNSADILRSKMDASQYKNYLLGLVFYKYLSDRLLFFTSQEIEKPTKDIQQAQLDYQETYNNPEDYKYLMTNLKDHFAYFIKPSLTFTALINSIDDHTFQLENLVQGFRNIEQSASYWNDLFSDIDLYSRSLGPNPQKQSEVIQAVMKTLENLDLTGAQASDVLGDAYEYLIGQFASDSGKKAGEFYTPQPVARLMTQIAIHGKEGLKGLTVYDPTMGSGSLLLNARRYSHHVSNIHYFGQELNTSTFNLAKMNMILHGVSIDNQKLNNADTLDQDWPIDEPTNFDMVLMNPPYSAHWSAKKGFKDDPRYSAYGVLAPKSKADFAFLLHGYYHLKDTGVMAIVLPHGVLFRGNAEGKIRQSLLENGAIDSVIGLPANIFYNTSIPTTIIILKKSRTSRDVLFIDASHEFEKGKNQNTLTAENIKKIMATYEARKDVDKYAHLATFDEIKENNFNLNIPRYVDTFEPEPEIPLDQLAKQISKTDSEIAENEKQLIDIMGQLQGQTPEAQKELDSFLSILGGVAKDSEEVHK